MKLLILALAFTLTGCAGRVLNDTNAANWRHAEAVWAAQAGRVPDVVHESHAAFLRDARALAEDYAK